MNEGDDNSIDFIDPSTKEQFDKLKDLLKDKISKYEVGGMTCLKHFSNFISIIQ